MKTFAEKKIEVLRYISAQKKGVFENVKVGRVYVTAKFCGMPAQWRIDDFLGHIAK